MEASGCDIVRLPEELLAAIISLTSPADACRAAAVCRDFRSAADSDAIWSRFLPRDLPLLVDAAELSLIMALPSYKARFLRLSDDPALLLGCRATSMWVDKVTGGKCYALSARALNISWGDEPRYWRWIQIDVLHDDIKTAGKRIASEAAQLLHVAWLEIRGRIERKMLSQNSTYGAYLVFRLVPGARGLGFPFQESLLSDGESVATTRRVCLHGYQEDGAGGVVPRKYVADSTHWMKPVLPLRPVEDDVVLPRPRVDGWMEIELGDGFYNHQGADGEVCVALNETKHLYGKNGLIVRSIEIRIKQQDV